jgi:hypothetical protein
VKQAGHLPRGYCVFAEQAEKLQEVIESKVFPQLSGSHNASMIERVEFNKMELISCISQTLQSFIESKIQLTQSIITITIRKEETNQPPIAPVTNAFSVMMKAASNNSTTKFLFHQADISFLSDTVDGANGLKNIHLQTMQEQIKCLLKVMFKEISLGYRDDSEEHTLNTFINSYSNVLCFIRSKWKLLFGVNFPVIPAALRRLLSLKILAKTKKE